MRADAPDSPSLRLLAELLEEGQLTLIDSQGLARPEGEREDLVSVAVDLMREEPGMLQLRYEPEPEPLGQLSVLLRDRARAVAMLHAQERLAG